ncbi:hypothetical protein JAAARDRAFT_38341 [Jaapia argillacea MUCL 33604]|uniref:Uncharacterized protein n=1 Tax=Jaapia argillacea MUCL 33604 TaxID=933084 RepID=A0A067PLE5_9AGAM|nr:hypothetical protein JAAARDRAFT_38341 [Jaapia argillacea MUCL 33604]
MDDNQIRVSWHRVLVVRLVAGGIVSLAFGQGPNGYPDNPNFARTCQSQNQKAEPKVPGLGRVE